MKNLLATALLIVSLQASHAVVITGFGTGQAIIDGSTDFPTVNQTATNVNVIGTDGGQIFAVTFIPVDVTGQNTFTLTGTLSGVNPSSQFTVELYNTDFSQSRTYNAFLSAFPSGSPSTATLNFVSQTAAFNDIGAFVFTGAGAGASLNFTFDSLDAVPEPSTYALVGLGLIGLVVARRFRKIKA